MTPVFRLAEPKDYFGLAKIWDASWQSTGVTSPETLSTPELAERLKSEVSSGADLYAVEDADECLGLLMLQVPKRQLSQLFLAPDAQGRGLGVECIRFTESALPNGFWLTVAEANLRARRFYERCGLAASETVPRPEYDRMDIRYVWTP